MTDDVALLLTATLRSRISEILSVMCELALGNLDARVPFPSRAAQNTNDLTLAVDGIRVALNMLAEELQATVIRKEQHEVTLSELAQAQSQLVHSAKLASLGQLAAGVAHELNQPLQIVGFAIDEIYDALADNNRDSIPEYLGTIEKQVNRGADVIARLLAFSRRDDDEGQPHVQINDLVMEAVGILGAQLTAQGIELRTSLDPDLAPVACNSNELLQVITNLVINARDAVKNSADRRIWLRTTTEEGTACLEVGDSGSGIDPTDLPRVFDPFFTTKPVGQGTGLGLSISHGIIRRYGGNIEALSEPLRGTRMRVTLPLVA